MNSFELSFCKLFVIVHRPAWLASNFKAHCLFEFLEFSIFLKTANMTPKLIKQ